MTNAEIRAAAVEYVATGQADYAQIFTDSKCEITNLDESPFTLVQVWVGIPTKGLVVPDGASE